MSDAEPGARYTGEAAQLLAAARRAAADRRADAQQQRAKAVAEAHAKAHSTVGEAHADAQEHLGGNLQDVAIVTAAGTVVVLDPQGKKVSEFAAGGASWVAVDDAEKRIYRVERTVEPRPDVRSSSGKIGVRVQVGNLTPHALDLYWVSYTGEDVYFSTIAANMTHPFETYASHVWRLVHHELGIELACYTATEQPHQSFVVNLASTDGPAITREFRNFTDRTVDIFQTDAAGREQLDTTVESRNLVWIETKVGTVFVVRDHATHETVAIDLGKGTVDKSPIWEPFPLRAGLPEGKFRFDASINEVLEDEVGLYSGGNVHIFRSSCRDVRTVPGLQGIGSFQTGNRAMVEIFGQADFGPPHALYAPGSKELRVGLPGAQITSFRRHVGNTRIVSTDLQGQDLHCLLAIDLAPIVGTSVGALALNFAERRIHWVDPSGRLRSADLDGNNASEQPRVSNPVVGGHSLAFDGEHRVLYWGTRTAIASAPLGSPTSKTLVTGLSLRHPAAIAVNGTSGDLFWNDGQQIWRADLDGGNRKVFMEGTQERAGLAQDASTGQLYWIEKGALTRASAEAPNPERVFALPDPTMAVVHLALVTVAGAATRRLLEAHAKRSNNHAQAAKTIADAHSQADTDRETARTHLANEHQRADGLIDGAQDKAAKKRADKQNERTQKHQDADQRRVTANTEADKKLSKAHEGASDIRSQAQSEADGKTKVAQDKLNDARRKHQGS
jgi:hypothetical protein